MEQHAFTLVLNLNETLVYSDWKRERDCTLILWLKGLMASNVYDAGLAGVRPNIRMENIIGITLGMTGILGSSYISVAILWSYVFSRKIVSRLSHGSLRWMIQPF
ncbi:uncharacterized protein LOC116215506 isoform X5 [Punica granatum]|uniref:Uncharacterized protein LOC116215506 isoform X5 n=1 Tax=Punica granatum TaxID=22663 RepID=A0A6P8EMI1_PUNGR|nr:uncharacterized protein LOC116215506 isoform X5 [Punica granatum]